MLGKLLKHELRATAHTMLPIFGVMLLVSAMANVCARLTNSPGDTPVVLTIIFTLVVILFGAGLFAIGLVTVFIMVRRFRDNLLRDEGYIMHTLPVSVHAQIWSKVLVSSLWYAASSVTMVLSILLVSWDVDTIMEIGNVAGEIIRAMTREDHVAEMIAEVLALLVLASLVTSLSFDAALSIGHSFAKNKMALSVLTFVGLLVLGEIFTYYTLGKGIDYAALGTVDFIEGWRVTCAAGAGILLAMGGACYAITAFFLKRKLNLE